MATTKTTTAKAADKKVETKTAVKVEEKKVAAKVAEKKVEPKTTAKVAEKKAEPKTTTKVVEKKVETKKAEEVKAEPKKAATKTTTKKPAAKKAKNVYVQFAGMEFDAAAIEKAVKADYTAKNGKKTMTSVNIYIKPEDMKAYYVIDGIIGDIAL